MEDSIEIPTEDSTVEITEEVELKPADEASSDLCSWKDKTVRQLKKAERQQLIDGFNNGKEDEYFKVMKMKNGQMRITKRTNPLTESSHEATNNRIEKQFQAKRLTDNQLLLEHIIDLEKRYEVMRMKHKKLKKRYNKLEQDIFDDSDEDSIPEQPTVNEVEVDSIAEQIPEQTHEIQATRIQPEQMMRNPRKRANWRSYIQSM